MVRKHTSELEILKHSRSWAALQSFTFPSSIWAQQKLGAGFWRNPRAHSHLGKTVSFCSPVWGTTAGGQKWPSATFFFFKYLQLSFSFTPSEAWAAFLPGAALCSLLSAFCSSTHMHIPFPTALPWLSPSTNRASNILFRWWENMNIALDAYKISK